MAISTFLAGKSGKIMAVFFRNSWKSCHYSRFLPFFDKFLQQRGSKKTIFHAIIMKKNYISDPIHI